jgi:GNAT superfamily N-acetyltransferase
MQITIAKTSLTEITAFRNLFLQENYFQFIHNKCHDYGWADAYLFTIDGVKAGYGSVWGQNRREDRDTIFEFYLLKPYWKMAELVFQEFIEVSGVTWLECQTNDPLLSSMVYRFSENIHAESILFEEGFQSELYMPGVVFRKKTATDKVDGDSGEYLLLFNDSVVADGGLMLNYNLPFADIYMRVKENERQKGYGSLIVQELKKEAYHIGRVPAARCNVKNYISRLTLMKAGFKTCGFLLLGGIKN